ncbi:uncharacterized protein M6B38_252915 [Iris pallida]|uniref:Uncharacterized protein n=1 Tax=Iris pallida TaxID=29817 RepID=A0AAX6IKJ3_IRIPA|nr:uncharacterized protein M6B38_252915 [Iris pallida]
MEKSKQKGKERN